jgi:hypothetical protein
MFAIMSIAQQERSAEQVDCGGSGGRAGVSRAGVRRARSSAVSQRWFSGTNTTTSTGSTVPVASSTNRGTSVIVSNGTVLVLELVVHWLVLY